MRLEKWIDTDLRYLRDAAEDSWCAIDLNMPPEAPLPTTEELPIFKVAYQNASICSRVFELAYKPFCTESEGCGQPPIWGIKKHQLKIRDVLINRQFFWNWHR